MTANLPPLIDVVLVDDDPIVAAFVRTALDRAGLSVVQCPAGVEAVNCIRAQRPRVVLLDVLMPEVHGVQLFLMLRRVRPRLPVICRAAPRRLRALLPDFRGQGAVLLEKPFAVDELLRLVRQSLSLAPLTTRHEHQREAIGELPLRGLRRRRDRGAWAGSLPRCCQAYDTDAQEMQAGTPLNRQRVKAQRARQKAARAAIVARGLMEQQE